MESLVNQLQRIPIMPVLVLVAGYLGYDYYSFKNDPSSPLIQKQTQLASMQAESKKLQEAVQKAQDFFRSLDTKREQIRALSQELEQMRSTLTENLDIPQFIKMVITEAGKVGIRVLSIKPTESKKHEYYLEQAFDLNFRGVYIQLLVFLDRLANLERVLRVDTFDIRRLSSSLAQYVELGGTIQIKAYKYLGSKADELAKGGGAKAAVQPAGAKK